MKKVLLVVATHGDEKIGSEVVKRLKEKKLSQYFDVLVANPQALAANQRFIDVDLNRSYPGQKDSRLYEERLACQNLELAKKYQCVIDLHEASAGQDDFIIVPRESLSVDFPIDLINLDRILLWPDPKGPMSQVLTNAIELEFGSKCRNREEMVDKSVDILEDFLMKVYGEKRSAGNQQEVYYVYGKIMTVETPKGINLVDFKLVNCQGEEFYPLLTGQYLSDDILCYKMRQIKQ